MFSAVRILLAKMGITWILITSPQSLALGPVVHLIHNFLPGSTNLNLVVPALSTELVVDTILVLGILKNYLFCLLPWMMINIMLVLGMGAGVMALLSTVILLPTNLQSDTDMDTALHDIKSFLMIIILNTFLILQMVNVSAVVQIFSEMKEREMVKNDDAGPCMENTDMLVTDVDTSAVDLLSNEERPNTPEQDHNQGINDSFDSFLYEDIP